MTNRPVGRRLGHLSVALALILAMFVAMLPGQTAVHAAAQQHYVRYGDTLSEIAVYYNVSLSALMQENGIRNPNHIYIGQTLTIPGGSMWGGAGGPDCASYHTVTYGETLSTIALRYGVDTYELAQANGIYDLNQVYVGQKLCIPKAQSMWKAEPMPAKQPMQQPKQSEPMMMQPMQPQQSMQQPMQPMQPQQPMMPMQPEPMMQKPEMQKPEMQKPSGQWKGAYYKGKYFDSLVFERNDPEINFDWGLGSPAAASPTTASASRGAVCSTSRPGATASR
ncbi:MAG: LysM peptidoglycan-binding domain-containing protein [Caldilineaceae bacterium]|nr:LysM peptidoglycan-binding domain-containing protein [Caldilineaceae bacterium]